jgi:multicomponent Na+:H+ antiporter subunit D
MNEIIDILLNHSPALIVAIPLLGAFLTPLVGKINDKIRNGFAIFIVLLTSFFVFLLANDVLINGNIHTYVFGGGPATIGSGESAFVFRILFEVDGLNAFMAIIVSILALVGVIYSWSFMKENTGLDIYYTLILLMIAGMFGMLLTGDMFNLFVFLEITSISACALIAFWTNKGKAVDAGFKYIVISAIGALFVLFAIGILYSQYNALNMAVLANSIQYTFLDKIALILLIAGLAMKAGIVPMHMWLPDAYGRAPSSVTLILIGATQASLYGIFRMTFSVYGKTIGNIDASIANSVVNVNSIGWIIILLAILTMIIGVLMALKQYDLKRLIAFAAVAEIGYMLLGLGVRLASKISQEVADRGQIITEVGFQEYSNTALTGSVFHIMNDALDIGLLFLVAGAIYLATRETNLNKLGGLARNMKYTTVFFLIGLLAVSGMPPMNGFASKLIIYESTYQLNPIIGIVAILCSILLLAVFVKVFHSAFLGPKIPNLKGVKEVPKSMLIAMGIIACIIIFFSLFPNLVVENIVQPATDAIVNYSSYIGGVIP